MTMKNRPDLPKPHSASASPNSACSPIEDENKIDKINNSLSLSKESHLNQALNSSLNNQNRQSSVNGRNKSNLKLGLSHNSSSNSPSFQLNTQMLSSAIRSSSRNNLPLTSKKMSFPLGKHSVTPPRNSTELSSVYDSSQQTTDSNYDLSEINNNKIANESNNDIDKKNNIIVQNENAYHLSNDSNSEVFEQKENNIITQINEISKSIEELLKQRKEIQFQHKRWLDDRKKKIFQVRKETNQMQNDGKTISSNMLLFPIITLVGPADSSIQQS